MRVCLFPKMEGVCSSGLCLDEGQSPFPPWTPLQAGLCLDEGQSPFPPWTPLQAGLCLDEGQSPFPPWTPLQAGLCLDEGQSPFPPWTPLQAGLCLDEGQSPFPPWTPLQATSLQKFLRNAKKCSNFDKLQADRERGFEQHWDGAAPSRCSRGVTLPLRVFFSQFVSFPCFLFSTIN